MSDLDDLKDKIKKESIKMISYREMQSHPIGDKIELIPGIFTQRLKSRYDVLFFKVIQAKGTIFPQRLHDCLKEIVVESGRLKENVSGRVLNQYDGLTLHPNQKSKNEALTDVVWYAHMYKNKK